MPPKFDVTTEKGLKQFSGFMGSKSYVEGWQFSPADTDFFAKFNSCPSAEEFPHAYRWYVHIAALQGVRGLASAAPAAAAPAAAEPIVPAQKDDDDDFDVFGDDDDEEEAPKESRKDMLARLKKEAEERTAKKEAKQRTLVAIEVKPWDTEQDLMVLWKKITTTIVPEGVKWAQACNLVDVAFGIKKIVTTFTMGSTNSSDDIVEAIEGIEDEVQSVEVISMNVL